MKHLKVITAKPIDTEMCGYVSVKVPVDTGIIIEQWLLDDCKFSRENVYVPGDMHTTIMHDERNPIDKLLIEPGRTRYKALPTGIDIFGQDDKFLVLTLFSPQLNQRHNQLLDMGMRTTYPQYRPHITLKSNAEINCIGKAIANFGGLISKLPRVIVLDNETWEPVNNDWKAELDK